MDDEGILKLELRFEIHQVTVLVGPALREVPFFLNREARRVNKSAYFLLVRCPADRPSYSVPFPTMNPQPK